jgi:hypothetical protein
MRQQFLQTSLDQADYLPLLPALPLLPFSSPPFPVLFLFDFSSIFYSAIHSIQIALHLFPHHLRLCHVVAHALRVYLLQVAPHHTSDQLLFRELGLGGAVQHFAGLAVFGCLGTDFLEGGAAGEVQDFGVAVLGGVVQLLVEIVFVLVQRWGGGGLLNLSDLQAEYGSVGWELAGSV